VHRDAEQHDPAAVRAARSLVSRRDTGANRDAIEGLKPKETACGKQARAVCAVSSSIGLAGDFMPEHHIERRNGIVERLSRAGLSLQQDAVRKAILQAFADEGKAPSVQELAHALGLPRAFVLEACRTLAASDLIVWQDDTTHIVSAYPFSGSQMVHQVLLGGHTTRYAMCAIDALGIPCMLGQGARIRSACFFCHTRVTVDIAGGLLHRASPSTLVVWLSERDGCCHAEVRCPLMNFFCEEAHLQAWHATSPQESGRSLSVLEALDVGKAAFGALLT
jgi:Alkylmercury lyase/IclR helix-turn-helix domain